MNGNIKVRESREESYFAKFLIILQKMGYLTIKRIFDICCGLIGCICMLPLMLIVKICNIASGDFKPIFYTQKRVGQN